MGHSTKKLDLTGHRFGMLMVLRPAENVDGRTAWLCRCDCGLETVVQTKSLRNTFLREFARDAERASQG